MKSELFEDQIRNGQALAMAIAIVPTIRKADHSKPEHLCHPLANFHGFPLS